MVTAKKTKQKRYPGCLAHALTGMFYSVVAHRGQLLYIYHPRSKYHTQLAKLSFAKKNFLVDLTAEADFFIFLI